VCECLVKKIKLAVNKNLIVPFTIMLCFQYKSKMAVAGYFLAELINNIIVSLTKILDNKLHNSLILTRVDQKEKNQKRL